MLGHVGCKAKHDALHFARRGKIGDVARETLLARLDLLEQWRLAGVTEGAAGARAFFEYRDRIAGGDQRGVGKAGRSDANHGDALALRRLRIGKQTFAAGGAIDDAADALAAAHFVDAGVAGETAAD